MRIKVIVLGSGVIGTVTAYYLHRAGCEVEVIERREESGRETSFANGGQLSFSHAEPWANPEMLKQLPGMFRKDAPLRLHPRADPALMRWCVGFFRACREGHARNTSLHLLRLGMYSKQLYQQMRQDTYIEANSQATGTLHLYRSEEALEKAEEQAVFQKLHECPYTRLDFRGLVEREPAFANCEDPLAGALYFPLDESGDAHFFTLSLSRWLAQRGVTFHYRHPLTDIQVEGRHIKKITAGGRNFTADRYVLALGAGAAEWNKKLGLKLPLYPMKGYSVTLACKGNGEGAPTHAVTDGEKKMVYSRLGYRLRAAGLADLGVLDGRVPKRRGKQLVEAARRLFPNGFVMEGVEFWSGLRPATPHGAPLLGACPVDNLLLNVGHGTLGWTLAAASGRILADLAIGAQPKIDLTGLKLAA